MQMHTISQRLNGFFLLSSFIFLADTVSLKGKRLDFFGRTDTYVSLADTIPELSRFTACADLIFMNDDPSDWTAFSYIINNTVSGRSNIDLGLAGDHQQLIIYNLGKTFLISYNPTPLQWHTICMVWDGMKGMLEVFLNKKSMFVMLDQPQNLTANGTLVLGHLFKNRDDQEKSLIPSFTVSLYYFQLWDCILDSAEFMKCLGGNVVSWEDDVWLVDKIIPIADTRLRCFVSENATIEETTAVPSQQADLTTTSQITRLESQKTVNSTMMSRSMSVFETDYTTVSYSNTKSPLLETVTAPVLLKTTIPVTMTSTVDNLSTSAIITLPTERTSLNTTNNSTEIIKPLPSETTRTTEMAVTMTTESFYRSSTSNFPYTSGFTKDSVVVHPSVTETQAGITKTTFFSSTELTPMSVTSWPKDKSTDIGPLLSSTVNQQSLSSTAADIAPWFSVGQTSATTTHSSAESIIPPESVFISTSAPVDSVIPRNQTTDTLATTDIEIAFTVPSMTHSTRPIEMTPDLRTTETESTTLNVQDVSSSRVEDKISTLTPEVDSSMYFSFSTSSPLTITQRAPTVNNGETTRIDLTSEITLGPAMTETGSSPTITESYYTQSTHTGDESTLPLLSSTLDFISKAPELGLPSTDRITHLFSTTWTSRPEQTLMTSAFHGSSPNTEHSPTTTNMIIPPEESTENVATTFTDATITTDGTTDRVIATLHKLTSPGLDNLSTVSERISVSKMPECKFTTSLRKTTPLSAVTGNGLLSTPKEVVDVISTLAGTESTSTKSASAITPMEITSKIAFGDSEAPVPESTATQSISNTVAGKDITSHHLEERSTTIGTAEVSPFAPTVEATDESVQMGTTSVTISSLPGIEMLTTPLDNKTATTEGRENWLSKLSVKTTPSRSYNRTAETFNSLHTYPSHWTSDIPSEGDLISFTTSKNTETFPESLRASTTRISGTSFATTSTDRMAVSLSSGLLPPQPTGTHLSSTPVPITHMSSQPVDVSAVTSVRASEETESTMPSTLTRTSTTSVLSDVSVLSLIPMTTTSVTPLDQTVFTDHHTLPTHRDWSHTTSEATVISVKMTPPLTEAPVSSLRSPTTGVTKTTLLFPSADTVNPAPHSPACSQTLPDDTPFLSSTHVISKMPTPVVTQPTSQVEQTSSYTLSFPYTSSNDGEIHTTEASIVHQTMPSHSSANKLTTSMDGPLSQSSTHFTTTPAPTHLVTEISTLSSDKEHMTITPENKKRTTEVTEIHSSKGIFISDSQTTPSSGMTGTGFNEVTQISSHQTHLPSEIPLVTLPDGISTSAPALGSSQNTLALTSSNTVDVHASELSTSLGKTVVPSQVLTTTTVFSPESKSVNALSVYTPQTVEMIANTTFAPNSDSYSQDNSFTDTMTSGITRISNMVSTDTTLSHFLSPGTPPEVETSTSSPISESTHGFFETLSLSTTGISGDDFTVSYTERITPTLSVPYLPTALLDKTSAVTYIPIYQLSSQPVNVSAFTSKRVLDTSTIITAKSKATHPNCLKGSTVATSRPMPEMSSVSVNDSTFSSPAVSSDTSTTVGSFAASLPLVTSGTVLASQTSTLDVTPVIYARSSDPTKSSSAFTPSEMTEVPSRITSVSSSFPTESALSSLKTITTISMTGQVTPLWGNTRTSLFSSRNTEAISSIPKGTSSLYLSTIQQSSRANEATTLGILPGATNNLLSTVRSGKVTALTDTFSRTAASESMLSSTPLNNLLTSLNIQGSPSFISFRSTLEPTKSVRSTMYFSSDTKKFTSSSENISPTELRKSTASETVSSTPFSTTPPSLTAFPFSLHSTKVPTSTSKISHPPVSQMTEFPVLRTRTTSSNTQSLLMTSWNAPAAEDSQSSVATTAHIPTPDNLETDSPYALPGSLPTLTASPTSITSGDATVSSMISLSGTLPTLEISKSPSLSISSKSLPTTVTETQSTLEKTTVTITPGFTLSSDPSGTTSKTIISKVTTLPTLTWVLSTFPSRSPHATASQTPHIVSSSTMDLSEPTFLPSDTMPTQSSTNFKPVSLTSVVVGQTTPTSTEKSITTGFLTALPTSIKSTDGKTDISKSHTASSKTTLIANSKTVSPPSSFSRVSRSPPMTKHTLSVRSMLLTSPMITSAWSRIPTASASTTFVLPKSTLDTLANITTTMATVRLTHPSVTTVSPLHSSSFETTWLSSTLPFLSMETSTSLVAAVSTVSFYNIEMNFSVFDEEPSIPITSVINELAENWLDAIFQFSEFSVANLAVEIKSRDTAEEEINVDRAFHFVQREGQGMATISHVLYSCVCQVIIKAISTLPSAELISRIQSKIHGNLTHGNFTQGQMILVVTSKYVTVEKLEPGKCDADETTSKYKGTYKWSLTNPTETAQTRCIKNEDANATRMCSINIKTGKSQWEKPRFKQCKLIQGLPDNILDLANITINDENADDVAEHILNLINESPPLDTEETKIIVSKMSDISYCDEISMNLTQIILQIIDAVLEKQSNSTSNLHEVTNEILRIIERTGHKMEFLGKKANLTVTRLALAVVRVERAFEGMTFSIRSYTEGTDPEIFLGDIPLEKVLASIYLPRSLRERIPLSNSPTILFNFFGQTSLFKIKSITQTLTSYVVSASISDLSIQNLADPVVITLQHIEENRNYDKIHCAFWDFKSNNGQGGWNSSGCKVKETTVNYTVCHCDHLTHFGVLMDLSRSSVDAVNERILTLITYTGCGISSIFLGVVMVTYIAFHKLRKDHPSKILINLCTALLMLNLVFLVNSWSSSFQKAELCIATAVMLHYFLLTSFSWMGLEAVHMYFALVKVFNIYIPNYILKFCLVGWGIPAIMVVIILSVNKDLYGTLSTTAPFCWIKDDSTFYASVVAYFCLVFLMNISMFCTVLVQLSSMKLQSQKTRQKMILHDFKGTMSLTVLLGLTWGFAFFAWGPVRILFLYLFAIFNTLQGFFIFMFHCMMKESVREQWQIHLNCGWLQLENSSDGSSRYGVNTGYKKERLKNTFKHKLLTPSLKSTATCSTFNSLGSVQCTPSEISFPNGETKDCILCI